MLVLNSESKLSVFLLIIFNLIFLYGLIDSNVPSEVVVYFYMVEIFFTAIISMFLGLAFKRMGKKIDMGDIFRVGSPVIFFIWAGLSFLIPSRHYTYADSPFFLPILGFVVISQLLAYAIKTPNELKQYSQKIFIYSLLMPFVLSIIFLLDIAVTPIFVSANIFFLCLFVLLRILAGAGIELNFIKAPNKLNVGLVILAGIFLLVLQSFYLTQDIFVY